MAKTIKPDAIGKELTKILSEYQEDTTEEVKELVDKVGKQCKDNIKANAPVKYGDYRKSWTTRKKMGDHEANVTVYARAPHYRLTHLLEKGHIKVNPFTGKVLGRVQAYPHIAPAEHVAQLGLMAGIKRIYK